MQTLPFFPCLIARQGYHAIPGFPNAHAKFFWAVIAILRDGPSGLLRMREWAPGRRDPLHLEGEGTYMEKAN